MIGKIERRSYSVYKIGELSRLCCIPVKTLRYYDSEGLLVPDEIDRFTGYRYYSASRIADCNCIISLKELGFSLEEIKKHMNASSDEEIISLIEAKSKELTEKAQEISLQLKKLNYFKKSLSERERLRFHVSIRNGDKIPVVYERKVFTTKTDVEASINKIKTALTNYVYGGRVVIVNYDIAYMEQNLDLAVCLEVAGKLSNTMGYKEKVLEFSDKLATLVCKREMLDDAYYVLLSQIRELDYQIVGASYELYSEDGMVEIKIPVRRREKYMDVLVERKEFENDEEAVGKWKIKDIVTTKDQFVYGYPKCPEAVESIWSELYFPEGGEPYWFLKGWTKGFLYLEATLPEPHIVANPYVIECLNGHTIMFLEIPRRYDDGSIDPVPRLFVFEKVSNQSVLAKDIICS